MQAFCWLVCALLVGLLFESEWGNVKGLCVTCVRGGGLLGAIVKVKYPFCDINRVCCPGLTQPGCRDVGITADSLCLGAHYHWKFVGGSYYGDQWMLLRVFGLS